MAAEEPTPALDRVRDYMRENPGMHKQGDVVAHFKDVPAQIVRLSLQALRKAGEISHAIEDKDVFYIWSKAPPRAPDAPPLRQAESLGARIPVSPTLDKVHAILHNKPREIFTCAEVATIAGITLKQARTALNALLGSLKIHAQGRTTRRRYSSSPFERSVPDVPRTTTFVPPKPRPEPAPVPVVELPKPEPELVIVKPADPPDEPDAPAERDRPDEPDVAPGSWPFDEIGGIPRARDIPTIVGPIAAITRDRRLVIVNGGRGTILDRDITRAVIDLVRTFDNAGLTEAAK
jgi:hypothetical protein